MSVTPKAGDIVIISELLTHKALIGKLTGREQRCLILRHNAPSLYYRSRAIMSNVWIKEDVRIEEPNLSKQGSRTYLSPVEACLETLMTYGTDRYGARHTLILVSILDIESRECPANPLPLDQQWRAQRPMRRNLAGANMLMDTSTLKTMYHLSEVTGGTKSANFAETYMDYYMTHLVDEEGLFWWGWHRHYDVYTD